MQVDKVDRDCLAVFGPRVAAFSGHLWETTLRSQTKVHLDHQDMEMDKAETMMTNPATKAITGQ